MNQKQFHVTKSEVIYNAATPDRFTFDLSVQEVDRDGDLIPVDLIDITQFLRNPVALYAHDSASLPVGKWDNLRRTTNARGSKVLRGDLVLAVGIIPLADQVAASIQAGFINACSIGFRPIDAPQPNPDNGTGFVFGAVELLECSICPVPANASALRVGKSFAAKTQPHDDGVFPDACDQHGDPDDYLDVAAIVSAALDQHDSIRLGDKTMTKEQFRNRLEFYRLKGGSNELTASRLKTIVDREFTKAATKAGFTGDGGTPGYSAQPVTETGPLATENELTIDRVRAILEAQGITGAELAEILGLLGADIGDGANLAGGANIGGPGPAGQPVNTEPQIASYTDRIKAAARN
jgi:HK97 family phage prohead protease